MILPTKFLWEQLDGPQVTAIENAIAEYWKQQLDTQLDYLNKISIDNANNEHLTFFGILSNFVRPLITVPSREYFYLTDTPPNHDDERGLSAVDMRQRGGQLVGVEGAHTATSLINSAHYRAILKAYIHGEGEIGSLSLLDDICYALTLVDLPNVNPFYEFKFMSGPDIPGGRMPGDLYIDIGSLEDWNNPMQIFAVLRGLAKSTYWPIPQIFISIDEAIQIQTPTSDVPPGTYSTPQTVTLSCATSGATIHYTIDGNMPNNDSPIYGTPLTISTSTVVKAKAFKEGYNSSNTAVFEYIIET